MRFTRSTFAGAVLIATSPTLAARWPSQELASAIEIEFALRLAASEEGEFSIGRFDEEIDGKHLVPWRRELALLDAAHRTGRRQGFALDWLATQRRARPALSAASLRLLDESSAALDRVIATGLASPHRAVRRAALERLALLSTERFAPLSVGIDGVDVVEDEEVRRFFSKLGLRSDSAAVLFDETADAARVLRENYRDWIRLPMAAEGVTRLRQALPEAGASRERGAAEALALVASVRDNEEIAPNIEAIVRLFDIDDVFALDALRDLGRVLSRTPGCRADESAVALRERALAVASDSNSSARARKRAAAVFARLASSVTALEIGVEFDAAAALEVLEVVDERSSSIDPRAVEPWLVDDRASVQEEAASIVGRRYRHGGEVELEPSVVKFLRTGSADLRSRAFTWLARDGVSEDVTFELRRAWDREDADTRSEWLGRIPRGSRWSAFRDVLLSELRTSERPDVSALELVAGFRSDDDVAAAALARLERAFGRIEGDGEYAPRLLFDGLAATLALALGDVGLDVIEDGLRRTMHRLHPSDAPAKARPKFPKTAVAVLSASDPSRVAWLLESEDPPRRVRFEAALQIAERSGEVEPEVAAQAARVLIDHYRDVDGTLRMRAVQGLGKLPPDVERERVASFAEEVASSLAPESIAAIDVLAHLGEVDRLVSFVGAGLEGREASATELEVARRAAMQIVRAGGTAEALLLFERARDLDVDETPVGEATRAVTGALLRALAAAAKNDAMVLHTVAQTILERPLAAARADLDARFEGVWRPKASFRWRYEIEAFESLARVGLDTAVFESAEDWPVIDGRLALAFGLRAKTPSLRVRLLSAALFALQGERAAPDRPRRLTEARLGLVDALRDDGQPRRAQAAILRDLLAAMRVGAVSGRVVGAVLDTRAGRSAEVHAEVAALTWRARAGTKGAHPSVETAAERWERAAARLP